MASEKWFINDSELDDYQYAIKELNPNMSYVVQGCAGSGKTILALWRAKELQETKKGSYIFIVYTKALRKFIDDGIRKIGIDSNNVYYQWDWEHRKNKIAADYFIIDEAQDFALSEVQYMKSSSKKSIMLFGDTAQQLYKDKKVTINGSNIKEKTASMPGIAAALNVSIRDLTFNYRLPKRIARFAEYLNSESDKLEPRCKKEGSYYPVLKKCTSIDEEIHWMCNKIQELNIKDVGILLPDNSHAHYVYNLLNKLNMKPEAKFDLEGRSIMSIDFSTDNPKVLTYHSAKGLQFQSVFLPKCEVTTDFYKNPIYVALTRTYDRLFISYSKELSPFLKLIPKMRGNTILFDVDTSNVSIHTSVNNVVTKEKVVVDFSDFDDDLPF